MKSCAVCNKLGKVHYRVKSIMFKNWIFTCKECWENISNQKDIVMVGQGNLNLYNLSRIKIFEVINYFDIVFYPLVDIYLQVSIILVKFTIIALNF